MRRDELAAIRVGARAQLMPLLAEGFGLPVVEALELRAAVLASDFPVFGEILEDIRTYLDCLESGWADERCFDEPMVIVAADCCSKVTFCVYFPVTLRIHSNARKSFADHA